MGKKNSLPDSREGKRGEKYTESTEEIRDISCLRWLSMTLLKLPRNEEGRGRREVSEPGVKIIRDWGGVIRPRRYQPQRESRWKVWWQELWLGVGEIRSGDGIWGVWKTLFFFRSQVHEAWEGKTVSTLEMKCSPRAQGAFHCRPRTQAGYVHLHVSNTWCYARRTWHVLSKCVE